MTALKRTTKELDWKALHARLAAARAGLEERITPSQETQASTLKQRSLLLANVVEREDAQDTTLSVLSFLLAPESYAVPCEYVRDVAALREYTRLPHAPHFCVGVTCLRGRMTSIMDLRRFFGLPAPGITDMNRVVVVTYGELEIGLLADRVTGVTRLAEAELKEPLPPAGSAKVSLALGIARGGLVVLDVPRLLSRGGLVQVDAPGVQRRVEDVK